MSIDETPTPDALDAAVEEARERVGHWITRGYADLSSYEHAAIDALVAAVEARAVARERARECVWVKSREHEYADTEFRSSCGAWCNEHWYDENIVCCYKCGGRVRVVGS
jgi:hypothetical protein